MAEASHHIIPRGLSREGAASYIGVGTTKFDELVAMGAMPQPKRIGARNVWDRFEVDESFGQLPTKEESNPWDTPEE